MIGSRRQGARRTASIGPMLLMIDQTECNFSDTANFALQYQEDRR